MRNQLCNILSLNSNGNSVGLKQCLITTLIFVDLNNINNKTTTIVLLTRPFA
jgi:hypothetical protein